jgi:hypothetical protein
MPGVARELRLTMMKPYSAWRFAPLNTSFAVLLADAGPPYTGTSTGYFFDGSKFEGNVMTP